jgi:hypothetical protein
LLLFFFFLPFIGGEEGKKGDGRFLFVLKENEEEFRVFIDFIGELMEVCDLLGDGDDWENGMERERGRR